MKNKELCAVASQQLIFQQMNIVNNKKQFRFEIELSDGEFARLEYRWLKGSMALMHTLVPVSKRLKGIGAKLVKHVLDYARSNNIKIIVYCPFVAKYIKDHPEYNDLKDETYKK
ncbi:MAG: GNAT family N-acetyltransferase [Sphingobacteriales bacterium]